MSSHLLRMASLLWAGAVPTLLMSGAVHGQAAPSAGANSDSLEEVVVTATRRAEAAQSIPVSITVVTAADLAAIGASQTTDLVALTPNLSVQGASTRTVPSYFIRGIGSTQFNPNANSKVGIYVDDVYLNSPAAQGGQLFDVDRVEVARGPQGYLFGQNTTAGLIRTITADPKVGRGFTSDIELTVGSYNQFDPKLAIGFDTGENSAARIGIYDQNRDGTQYNTLLGTRDGSTNVLGWRAKWLWQATSDVELLLNVHGSRDRSQATPYKQLGLVNPATGLACAAPGLGSGCTDFFGYADTADYHHVQSNIGQSRAWLDAFGASATLNWQLPAFALTSVTSYEQNTSQYLEDTDASPNDVVHGSYYGNPRQFSEEVRLTSREQRLRWIAGLYYFHEDLDSSVGFPVPGFGPSAFSGVSGVLEGFGQVSSMKTDSIAGFGNVDFAATDRLKLSLGLRYTHETKDVEYAAYLDDVTGIGPEVFFGDSLIRGTAFYQTIDFAEHKSWDNVSGRVSAAYTLAPGVMAYTSFSEGYNSGNYNGGAFFNQAEAALVNPETLQAWEVGLKSELGTHLRLNIDAFHYDFKNQQVFILASTGGSAPFQQLTNAAASSVDGGEVELTWKPSRAFLVQAGAGYTKSRFDSFISPLGGDFTGNTLPNAPESNFNAAVRYEVPISAGMLAFQVDAKYQSLQYFSVNNDPLLTQDAYTLANANISFTTLSDRLTFTAWVRNLSDEQYLNGAYDISAFGFDEYTVGLPRTYGLTIQYRVR